MSVQHHPTLLDATCWPRLNTTLDNVGRCWLEYLLKIFVKHCATLLAQQRCTMLASFEKAYIGFVFNKVIFYLFNVSNFYLTGLGTVD